MKNRKLLTLSNFCLILALLSAMLTFGCAKKAAPVKQTVAPTPAAQVFKWKAATQGVETNPWHALQHHFADQVLAISDGRIQIEVIAEGTLFPVGDTLDNVVKNVVQMGMAFGGYYAGKDPTFTTEGYLIANPLGDLGEMSLYAYKTDFIPIVRSLYKDFNAYYIGPIFNSTEQFLTKTPITKASDFKGMKIRASGTSELLFKELGASVTYIATPEVYTAVQMGTVDAADMSGAKGNWEAGLHELAKYIIEPNFYTPCSHLDYIINMDTWNSLPKDMQALIELARSEQAAYFWMQNRYDDLVYQQKMIDYGLQVITIAPEEMAKIRAAASKVWDSLASKTPRSAQIIAEFKKACRLAGKPVD